MVSKQKLKIGVDMDGVVAKHELGGFWVWLRKRKEDWFKRSGDKRYYFPRTAIERFAWRVINRSKKPSISALEMESLIGNSNVELYLVTSRFKFLEQMTCDWLDHYGLKKYFKTVRINKNDLDPLEYKHQAVKELGLVGFIDDDLELVDYFMDKLDIDLFWVVPKHRNRQENGHSQVFACSDFKEALKEVVRRTKKI